MIIKYLQVLAESVIFSQYKKQDCLMSIVEGYDLLTSCFLFTQLMAMCGVRPSA
jgi:hypothetical protein